MLKLTFLMIFGLIIMNISCSINADIDSEEFKFLYYINIYRNGHPLTINPQLTAASAWKSTDMAIHDYVAHDDRSGRTFDQRISAFGYTNFFLVGENILAGPNGTAEDAFQLWKDSPDHNANMLNPAYKEIGIGRRKLGSGAWYWTTDFGAMN